MRHLILFFIGLGFTHGSLAQVVVTLPEWKSYGPYVEKADSVLDTNKHCAQIQNLHHTDIDGTLKLSIFRNQQLICETQSSLLPSIHIPSMQTRSYPILDLRGTDPFFYYDTLFKDSLKKCMVNIANMRYNITAEFEYMHSGQNMTSGPVDVVILNEPVHPIDTLFPNEDTLTEKAPEIVLQWKTPGLLSHVPELYKIRVYEVFSGQTPTEAIDSNPPLLDTVAAHSLFSWDRSMTDKPWEFTSDIWRYRNFCWTVENVLPSPFSTTSYNNRGLATFTVGNIPLPKFDTATTTEDTTLIIMKGTAKGFNTETIISGLYNGVIQPHYTHSPSYKNLTCPNGGVEDSDFSGWTGDHGEHLPDKVTFLNKGISYDATEEFISQHFIYQKHPVDGPLLDKKTQAFYTIPPRGGDYAIRLGDLLSGAKASMLKYKFTVNSQNKDFQFLYAVVLQDPTEHEFNQKPFFSYDIKNLTDQQEITKFKVTADVNDPYFKQGGIEDGEPILYKSWTCVPIDLSAYMGKEVEIRFATADCTVGGHFGYAYIDGLCETNDPVPSMSIGSQFCFDDDINPDGNASQYESDHRWSVEESDINWGRNQATEETTPWFIAQEAGEFDIKAFYESRNRTFRCDQYYRVKLIVRNGCDNWEEQVKLIYIKPCVIPDAGPDLSYCFNDVPSQVLIGDFSSNLPSGVTWSWSPNSGTSPNTWLTPPTSTTTYTLTSTYQGCDASDEMTIFIQNTPPVFTISYDKEKDPCDNKVQVTINIQTEGHHEIQHSQQTKNVVGPGSFDLEIDMTSFLSSGMQNVTVENECGYADDLVTTVKADQSQNLMYGQMNTWDANMEVCSTCPYPWDDFKRKQHIWDGKQKNIAHWPLNDNTRPAYNVVAMEFELFHRSGTNPTEGRMAEKNRVGKFLFQSPLGLRSGDVNFDMKMDGEYLPFGYYVFTLRFRTCPYNNRDLTQYSIEDEDVVFWPFFKTYRTVQRTGWQFWYEP